ncbi:hypothetical protein PPTG_07728 [Phytophthora nicotianae INRA-310]|uniref:RxLR effector protein n=1 Tax=Phytophthora nicotianae (strain INRA-310) TaxID=761204 RepID=W2QQE7_PHYN3|nr:hypothetical protein PPTG_07728 [Phytophthora nicotianae INRA-310]ETN14739.1 hypothetical protein PPTG_07728 [Phytophthora nicotianae INRA-310]
MPARTSPTSRLDWFLLLSIIALLTYVNGGSVAAKVFNDNTKGEVPNRAADAQTRRYLREPNWLTTGNDGDNFEERAIDVKLPMTAKLQNLVNSPTLKSLATSIKHRLTSNNQIATDKLFARLNVGAAESKLFESAPYQQWVQSVTTAYKNTPGMGEAAMFSTLTTHYGDEVLAKLLIDNWVAKDQKADDIYALLKLSVADDALLKNPLMNTWIYVTRLGKEDPYDLLLLKLKTRYDEAELAHLLIAAKADNSAESVAKKVEQAQLKNWLTGGKTEDDAFNLLRLSIDDGYEILKNPALSTWNSYVKMLKHNPDELLFLKLKRQFSDYEIAKLDSWVKLDKTADDIFNVLKLNKEGDKLFESPVLSYWVAFVMKGDKENADELMYSVMKKYYGDDMLEKLFARVKGSASTKRLASKLEQEMWMSHGKTEDDIFNYLKLGEKGDGIFKDPALTEQTQRKPDEFAVISALEKHFDYVDLARKLGYAEHQAKMKGDTVEIVTSLQNLQFKQWMTEKGLDPNRVGRLLIKSPRDTRNNRVLLDFYDFYRANGGQVKLHLRNM